MEVPWCADVFGSGAHHDVLRGHRRLDHEVRVRVSDGAGFERGAGRLLYVVYHVAGVACGVRPAVYGGDSVHCV